MQPTFMRSLVPLFLLAALAAADDTLAWIRYPAISPDGKQICFSYRGDLWLVPSAGGTATPFTRHVAYERSPVWSRDGQQIAYATDRHGNFDVYVKRIDGGPELRLTHHSGHDIPSDFSVDGKEVLFAGRRAGDPAANPGNWRSGQLYAISVEGGRPRLILPTTALHARLSPDGKRIAYESRPAGENAWRKHHTSSATRDIWVYDTATKKHTQWSGMNHEHRNPVWDADDGIFYLCEHSGSFNIWHGKGDQFAARTQHAGPPVRFLSRATDGTLCYTLHDKVYLLAPNAEPKAITIQGRAADLRNRETPKAFRKGASQFAVSPDEKEVAFVVRGELFVASVEHGTTKRITNTATQERSPEWAPDGKSIYFAGERDGSWNLYRVTLGHEPDKHFFRATLLKEEPVLVSDDESFQPKLSPDGKHLAFLHNRDEIRVLELASGNAWTLVPPERNYSYSDGDLRFTWSPDSKWLAFTLAAKGRWIENVGVRNIDGGEIVDMTLSGYWEGMPRWSADSRSLLFASARLGRRSHGSWGSEADVFAMDLNQAASDHARLSVEEFELQKKKGDGRGKGNGRKDDDEEEKVKKPAKPVVIKFDGRDRRTRRLTLHSARLFDYALSPDGESLATIVRVGNQTGVWLTKWRKGETKRLMKLDGNGGELVFDRKGKALFVSSGSGRLFRVELKGETKPIGYAARMEIDAVAERAYIFEHAWRQVRAKFYDPKLHGVDWVALRKLYEPMLAHVDNSHDFAELLSELLGELNASHTGCYYRIPQDGADATAALGLLFDSNHRGDGLKVSEVLVGGPCARADAGIVPGAVLNSIDGTVLAANVNPFEALNRRAGQRVLLGFTLPGGNDEKRVVVKAIDQRGESSLRYRRWVEQRRALVDKLSGGTIGYVHVAGMNDRSFRHLYQETLGRYGDRKALIVDTRNNGGGWLHDDLIKFLGGQDYLIFHPRGKERGSMGGEPFNRWTRPVAVVVSESNYSDAHLFPYAFQKLKIGPVVGAPIAGTGTAVWWESQIDASLVFGIPQVGMVEPGGSYVENRELVPDSIVRHHPDSAARGEDKQLEKAVELMKAASAEQNK